MFIAEEELVFIPEEEPVFTPIGEEELVGLSGTNITKRRPVPVAGLALEELPELLVGLISSGPAAYTTEGQPRKPKRGK